MGLGTPDSGGAPAAEAGQERAWRGPAEGRDRGRSRVGGGGAAGHAWAGNAEAEPPPLPGAGEFAPGGVPPRRAPAEPRLPAGEGRGGGAGGRGGRGRRARGRGGAARQQIEQQQAAQADQRRRYLAGEPHGGGRGGGSGSGRPPAAGIARHPARPRAGTWPPSPGPAAGSGGGARPTVLSGLAAPSARQTPARGPRGALVSASTRPLATKPLGGFVTGWQRLCKNHIV